MKISRFNIDFDFPENQIYLDSATLGKMPIASLAKMTEYYKYCSSAAFRGVNQDTLRTLKELESNREYVSNFFRTDTQNVSFLPSKEVALTNVLFGINNIKEKKIVTSVLENHSLLAPSIKTHQMLGTHIDYLSINDEINILDSIQEKIVGDSDILLLSALTTTNGVLRDWKEISKICKENNTTFILDISNIVGHEVIHFYDTTPDIVLADGSVGALGPQGIAFQIISEEMNKELDPLIVGGGPIIALEEFTYLLTSTGSKFECGIINSASISALVNSLKLLFDAGLDKIHEHDTKLNNILRQKLKNTPNIEIYELDGAKHGPITSFACKSLDANDIAIVLEELKGIIIRSGALCAHLFMYELPYNDIARVSTHLYNTEEEIKIFIETLHSILS